jgi:hypothetical protein
VVTLSIDEIISRFANVENVLPTSFIVAHFKSVECAHRIYFWWKVLKYTSIAELLRVPKT